MYFCLCIFIYLSLSLLYLYMSFQYLKIVVHFLVFVVFEHLVDAKWFPGCRESYITQYPIIGLPTEELMGLQEFRRTDEAAGTFCRKEDATRTYMGTDDASDSAGGHSDR